MIPEADDSSRHGRNHDDETLTARGEDLYERASEGRRSARTSGCRLPGCEPRLEIRDEIEGVLRDGQRRMIVSRRVGKAVEGKAVAARQRMVCRGWRRIMPMSDMRNRVDRERQQQCREGNSQPLRRSSGQMHQAHERQGMTGRATE